MEIASIRQAEWRAPNTRKREIMLWLLILVAAMSTIDRQILPLLTGMIQKEYDLTDAQVGFLGFIFGIVYSVATTPLSALADRVDRRRMLAACIGFFSLCSGLCGVAPGYASFLAMRVGVAFGESAITPISQSIISDLFPASDRTFALSKFVLSSKIGGVLAFLMAGWLGTWIGWRDTFLVLAIPGLIVALLALRLNVPPRGASDDIAITGAAQRQPNGTLRQDIAALRGNARFWHICFGWWSGSIFTLAIIFWIPVYAQRMFGTPLGVVGTYMSVYTGVLGVLGVVATGWLGGRLGRRDERWNLWLIIGSIACAIPCIIVMFTTDSGLVFLIAGIVPALMQSAATGPASAMVQAAVPARMRSTAAGIMQAGSGAAMAIGPLLAGVASDLFRGYGQQSLRYALLSLSVVKLWSLAHFVLAGRGTGTNGGTRPQTAAA